MNNDSILAYKDWLNATKNSATLATPYEDYLDYVNEWYENTFHGKTTEQLTAEEYQEFLLTIKVVTTDPDVLNFINRLDYDNEDELKTSIPYFAKNLRDIARYISIKRDDGKYASVDYSYLGSNVGLEAEIYRTLLQAYIGNSDLPEDELETIISKTSIEVLELYDDNEYMDKSPNKVAGDYYDMDVNAEFYSETDPEYLKWVVGAGFNDLVSNNDTINPSVSGTLPLSGYINYDSSGEQTSHFKGNLPTNIMGEEHYFLSGDDTPESMEVYSTAKFPWDNLSNRYFPTIANLPLVDSTYSKYSKGEFLIPSKIGMVTALGKNKFYKVSELEMQGSKDNFPDPSLYSNGYSFTREYQDASIVYDSYLNWIDIKQVSGRGKGILTSDGTYQEMTPYQTTQESTSVPFLGMSQVGDKTDPWYLSEDKTWEDNANFPPDFRKIYDIDAWYDLNVSLSGNEDNWGIDIYGNNYGLYKENNFANFYERSQDATGKLYVRDAGGAINTFADYFNTDLSNATGGVFDIDALTCMGVYNDLIVLESEYGVVVQKITFENGEYLATSDNVAGLSGDIFDHFFDDRTNTLYAGTYELLNGFLEIVLYKFEDGRFITVYDTSTDTSNEITSLRNTFNFAEITPAPSITISPIDDKMYLTYIGGTTDAHIVIIPLIMQGGLSVDEIIVVSPTGAGSSVDDYATESRKLIQSMISTDKLILMLEGSTTDNKYLQVIPL